MRVEQLVVGQMGVCCYILSCEQTDEAVVIDPGGDEALILKHLDEHELDLKYIVNTHCHPDHTCGNGKLKEATGAAIVMHMADIAYMAHPDVRRYFSMLGLPESPPADIPVKDGEELRFGEKSLQVIHTPGHSPGGMCLYRAPHCFTGDTLFVEGIGRADFPGCSYEVLVDSIRSRLFALPPETIVWPGHAYGGLKSTIGQEEKHNRYL